MALIDDIKEEIKRAHMPKVPEQEKKPEKKRRQRSKEEIAAYIARKQAEEERRMLENQGAEKPKRGRKRKPQEANAEIKDSPVKSERKKRIKNVQESTCTKPRPKHFQTIELPDGGSIVLIYMPGATS